MSVAKKVHEELVYNVVLAVEKCVRMTPSERAAAVAAVVTETLPFVLKYDSALEMLAKADGRPSDAEVDEAEQREHERRVAEMTPDERREARRAWADENRREARQRRDAMQERLEGKHASDCAVWAGYEDCDCRPLDDGADGPDNDDDGVF